MPSEKYCFHIPEEVAEIDGVSYYCADRNGAIGFEGDAVINFTGQPNIPLLDIPELAEHVDITFKEVVVAWPDFGVPKVKSSFWQALHSYILSQGWKKVCLHCAGGHGRTGTAMSALLIATAGTTAPDAVEYVRSIFCEKMVETAEQCAYLCRVDEELNGRKTEKDNIPIPAIVLMAQKMREEERQTKGKK